MRMLHDYCHRCLATARMPRCREVPRLVVGKHGFAERRKHATRGQCRRTCSPPLLSAAARPRYHVARAGLRWIAAHMVHCGCGGVECAFGGSHPVQSGANAVSAVFLVASSLFAAVTGSVWLRDAAGVNALRVGTETE